MSVIPLVHRAKRLADFLERTDLWFVLGGQSPWRDETLPPPPDPDWLTVPEAWGFKQADTVVPVFPDVDGPLFTPDGIYRPVEARDVESLLLAKALQAFVSVRIRPGDFPTGLTCRIVGLTTGLRRHNSNRRALLAEDVIHPGLLLWVSTYRPFRVGESLVDLHVILHF